MSQNRKYVVSERCSRACSLHADSIDFPDLLLQWYNDRRSIPYIIAEAEKRGTKLSTAAVSRHRKHLDYEEDVDLDPSGSVDHLKVLQMMIARGAKSAKTWRIGPSDTLKAMQMYYTLTQGSVMKDLFAALTAVAAGEDADSIEEIDAGSLSPAETQSVGADDDGLG